MFNLTKGSHVVPLPIVLDEEELEHWVYRNRKELFKIHLDNDGITWRDISRKVSEIFGVSPAMRTTDFLKIVNTGFWVQVNKTPVFSR